MADLNKIFDDFERSINEADRRMKWWVLIPASCIAAMFIVALVVLGIRILLA